MKVLTFLGLKLLKSEVALYIWEVDDDDESLMDNDSHSDLDSGASDTMDYSYDAEDRDYYYDAGGCVVYVPRGAQHVHYAAYTGIIS